MTTRDPNTILAAEWDSGNVSTPTFLKSPKLSKYVVVRGVIQKRLIKEEEYMGIFSRTNYTPNSHDAWQIDIVSTTESDAIAIIDEIRRICATFSPTSTEKIMNWQGGDWILTQPFRHEFSFIIFVKKSGIDFS